MNPKDAIILLMKSENNRARCGREKIKMTMPKIRRCGNCGWRSEYCYNIFLQERGKTLCFKCDFFKKHKKWPKYNAQAVFIACDDDMDCNCWTPRKRKEG